MFLLGATLTKLLATLAAIMTVTAGLPSFQCRCPDGRVKYFCQGGASSPAGCCCSAEASASSAAPCCGAKKANTQGPKAVKKGSCCAQSHGERQERSGSDDHRLAAKDGCCVKTVVAAPAVDSVEGTGVPAHQSGDTLALREPALVPPYATPTTPPARPPELRARAPDLVVVLCHFTC